MFLYEILCAGYVTRWGMWPSFCDTWYWQSNGLQL